MLWGFFLIHSISYRHFRWEFLPKESSLDLFPEAHKQTGPCAAQGGLASHRPLGCRHRHNMPPTSACHATPACHASLASSAAPAGQWGPVQQLWRNPSTDQGFPASMLWFGRTSDMWHPGWFRKDIRCGANNSSVFRHELNSSSVKKESFSWKWISSWVTAVGVGGSTNEHNAKTCLNPP